MRKPIETVAACPAEPEDTGDWQMTAKLTALSNEEEVKAKMCEAEQEARSLREFGKSRRLLEQIWDNPHDAEYNKL